MLSFFSQHLYSMSGVILQLNAQGDRDRFIYVGNPTASAFNKAYTKTTNFSMAPFEILMQGNDNFGSKCTGELLSTSGDLLNNAYIKIELPGITHELVTLEKETKYGVTWVRNVGLRIISSISLYLGTNKICTHTSDYLNIEYDSYRIYLYF